MAFDVTALGNYTKESVTPLLTAAVLGGKIQEMILKQGILIPDTASVVKIPLIDTDATFQNNACGWSPSGTTTITQRTVTPGRIMIQEALCFENLKPKFTQMAVQAGTTPEKFSMAEFEKAYLELKNAKISQQNEIATWQGDTASGNANLNRYDGLIKLIDAGSPVDANVNAYTGAGVIAAITAANVISVVKAVKNAIPNALKGMKDVVIFSGYDVYDMYVDAGVAANYFHYNFNDQSNYGGLTIPGTGIRLEASHGLNGTGDLYAFRMSNVAAAFDVKGEEAQYELFYAKEARETRYHVSFSWGVNVAFTTECVKFKSTI